MTKKEVIEELICNVEILILDVIVNVETSHYRLEGEYSYVHQRTSSLGRISCSFRSKCAR